MFPLQPMPLREERCISPHSLRSTREESQGRKSIRAGTRRQELKQRTRKSTTYLLSLLSYTTQDHLPRVGPAHSELGPHVSHSSRKPRQHPEDSLGGILSLKSLLSQMCLGFCHTGKARQGQSCRLMTVDAKSVNTHLYLKRKVFVQTRARFLLLTS